MINSGVKIQYNISFIDFIINNFLPLIINNYLADYSPTIEAHNNIYKKELCKKVLFFYNCSLQSLVYSK